MSSGAMVKVLFRLEQDDAGYPPTSVESLWAIELPDGTCEIRNNPFYVWLVSWGDVVAVRRASDGAREFERVVRPGGHSTIRVLFADLAYSKALTDRLEQKGCGWEGSTIPDLISIDVPPEVSLVEVQRLLAEGKEDGKWEYEESCIEHPEVEHAA